MIKIPEMIVVPQRSIKERFGWGPQTAAASGGFRIFAASCLGGRRGQQGGETIGVPCRETGHVWGQKQTSRKSCGGLVMLEDSGLTCEGAIERKCGNLID